MSAECGTLWPAMSYAQAVRMQSVASNDSSRAFASKNTGVGGNEAGRPPKL